jgi:hypothetical protein
MRDTLDEINQRYPKPPEKPIWKLLLRFFLTVIAALAIAVAANWMLDFFHLNPLGIRELDW